MERLAFHQEQQEKGVGGREGRESLALKKSNIKDKIWMGWGWMGWVQQEKGMGGRERRESFALKN